jgi:hypothetical protein
VDLPRAAEWGKMGPQRPSISVALMKKKFLKVGPAPDDHFEMLLFVLTHEVTFARLHLQIARGLAKEASDQPRILHCARTFFAFTFRAHLESAYARAARLFDPTSGTVTIASMIRTAKQRAGTFQFATPAEVRKKIGVWQGRMASVQPLLEKLHDLRNGLIAHLDREVILDPNEMTRTVGVTFEDIDQILEVAGETLNDALESYNNATYADQLLSKGDHEALFRILEKSLLRNDSESLRNLATHDEIEQRAYQIYVDRGRTDGNDVGDWLRAERELRE